ncbi:TipJ family phage tail tip protein [Moraxella bovis]|uniref:TipJ family phage tail tip protein n=1 Tax=Moraxella bovis TaxID=476 RepID=UPI000DC7A9F8|nr:phage tail protein [Moraxella bovis]AWY19829.1 phage tail protein [Moraxella bovis]
MNIHGAKKGGGKQRQPIIAPDSAQSKTFISIMYGLGEGEIAGLANGYKSVYLEDTPLQNDNGEFNFADVKVDFRTGTNDQEYIDGFPDVASETAVNVELKHGTPFVKAFNNLDLDALRVRLKWGALRQQNRENGDVSGVKIDYAIDVKTDNGGWVEVLNTSINAKTSDAYERSHRIDLPKAQTGWQLRVRRITPNSTSEFISDKMFIAAISEVIDLKLRYPNTALLGLRYDAESFSNVAKMSARCKGLIIKVPTNYDPVARTYTGMWDGQFKMAYSNNPAWVYYDLCTAERYGLGGRLTQSMIDKWSLYRLAQYCDEMVDDGMGGQEPRFTVNVYIQSADGAFELLSRLAGVFRAISYWDGNSIVLDADIPQDSIYSFSRANVIDGVFEYTGTRSRDRRTVAKVAWDNPANHFKTEYEYVRDEAAIAKFGVRVADISAWGCTSRGQAQRAGLWALKSEQLETRMVTFKVGLDGYIPAPAKVIEISDELFAGRATGGRVLAVNKAKTVITLDRTITAKAGDTLVINGDDGTSQRRQIRSVSGDKITVTKAFGGISVENVWVLDSSDLATMKFRVLSVTADDNHQFTITAVQYNPAKYDAIDHGAYIDERPISVINPTVQAPTKSVNVSSYQTINQGMSVTTLVIDWEQVAGAVKYQVEWRKDNGNWQALPPTGTNSIEISGVYAGQYEAKVTAISAFGQASLATHSALTQIVGKVGRPNRPAFIRAIGVLFGMNLAWGFGAKSEDTNFTEIQVSPDGRTNITTLGTFAYPTNKHEITGLQGNLTQFYRARIVDKLGNASDWTAWTSGTTSADADKVLNLISGQISESHLDQTLRTPIGKIGTLESAVGAVNGNLGTLNSQLANTQNELNTAKSTLQTAVANITTERNRINTAIRDITALQTANNAKTQEIANLTQTVGGHTSSIRDLGVTTGDLSQKYTALKTASDNATSEITAIKQTQSGQATTINRLNSEMNAKASTANLETLRQSMTSGDNALSQRIDNLQSDYDGNKANIFNQIKALSDKDTTTASQINQLTVNFGTIDGRTKWTELRARTDLNTLIETGKYFIHAGSNPNAPFAQYAYVVVEKANDQRITQTAWADNNASLVYTRVYNGAWQVWEKTATGKELDSKASTASLNEFKQTSADADTALGERITAIDTAYKSADNNLTARLAREETARVNGDTANAQALRTVESTVNGIGGRVGTSESKIASLERTTSDTNQALATAQSQLNARFDNLAVGGRNLLLNTQALNPLWTRPTSIENGVATFVATGRLLVSTQQSDNVQALENGKVTISFTAKSNRDGRLHIRLRRFNTNNQLSDIAQYIAIDSREFKRYSLTLDYSKWTNQERVNFEIATYERAGFVCEVKLPKLEIGTIPTDWTPAPEDLQADIDAKASSASLDEFKRTQAQKDTATAQKLSTLQTTVNGQTTSIRNVEQSVNGVRAIKAVTVDNNGFISGYGLMSELQNGRVTSRFGINADQIYFGATTTAKKPFVFTTRTTTIDGVSYPAGAWLNSASIANASIKLAHIDKASIGSLSALSANIGHFKSAQTGARLEIKDSLLMVYDENNVLRVRLGLW